ncbi:uncharacterized protein LOC123297655 [Chrysoperla carnea]|uniref:uncharacterized protein LOC123297655 n=1 Tax=Chrysoperla carnea TaxID=189513 RepID=UPI001D06969C|nr:uncharacterized protein LOC123297655 [Chrysoperla carnea]
MSVIGLKFWKHRDSITEEENIENGKMTNKLSAKHGGAGDAPLTSYRQRNRTNSTRAGSRSAPPTSNLSGTNINRIYLNSPEIESPVYKSTTIPLDDSEQQRQRFSFLKWFACFSCSSTRKQDDENESP